MGTHVTRAGFGLVALFAVVGIVGGCAGYKIQENGSGCGYDVYAPEPYLQATPKMVKGAANNDVWVYDFTLIWLPNYSKRYRVSSWAGLGKADFAFKFDKGWMLTSIDDKSDNTNIMTALTSLAAQLLPTDPWKTDDGSGKQAQLLSDPELGPILFRIDFDTDGRPACLTQLRTRKPDCGAAGAFPIQHACR